MKEGNDTPFLGLGIVLSGPSGVGKNTIQDLICQMRPKTHVIVSWTTRPKRKGEVDGDDYRFVTREVFAEQIQSNGFIEWANVHDEWYGKPRTELERCLRAGEEAVLILDVQGGMTVKNLDLPLKLVFISPPSMEELERRLAGRGSENSEKVRKRLDRAYVEMAMAVHYDANVINDNAERSALEICQQMDRWRVEKGMPALTPPEGPEPAVDGRPIREI